MADVLPPGLLEVQRGEIRLLTDDGSVDGVGVWFTDRDGGVGSAPYRSLNLGARVGDDPEAVESNRARVARSAGFDLERLALARQVHGADTVEVIEGMSGVVGEADVLVTRSRGAVLGILTADCAPVVIAGDGVVAVAHAGWRGLVAGAIERALELVGSPVTAWVGPAIGACCYEVGPDVTEAFERAGLPVAGERCVDPAAAAAAVLEREGVPVAVSGLCTAHDPRYFSYRREGVTGRQGAFVSLR